MGVSGLPSVIKRTKGFIACDLKKKKCHVDLLSLHFGLMKVHCYHSTATGIRKAAAAATVQSEVVNKKRPASEPPVGQRPVKLRAVDAACDMQGSVEGIKRTPVESILDKIRFATKSLSQDDPQSFQYVATTLDSRLTVYLDKSRTTIHVDGLPSIQKSLERKARQDRLNAELEKLEKQATQFVEGKSRSPAKLFKRCRGLYRPPPTALEMIVEGLTSLGWKVCRCPYQADTHIGELCRDETDKASLAVISNDSDLLIYDGVSCVTMPVGKSRELTTFSKASLLEELDLPSSRHLQLAAMLTKNDYFGGTRTYGIIRNAELVRNLSIDINGQEDECELVSKFNNAINDYFALIKSPKVTPTDDLCHAISAFVLCRESHSVSAAPSPQTHQRVSKILRQLEDVKIQRRGLTSQACNVLPSTPTMIKKREEWMKSKFKSPNLDKNPRYTAHVVKDVTSACPVDEDILEKLTPVVPKPRKPKTESEKEKEKARQGLKKKKKRQKKAPPAKPTGEGSRNIGEPKALKKLYDTTFKTVTLTFGCFTGTLRRATSMSKDEARVVADHLDKAVHTLSKTRILVFKALELFVLREVTSRKPSDIEQSDVVPSSSGSTTTNDLSPTNSPMDPLDLFLNKQHGQTLIRNLISLVLNGGIDRGRTSKDAHGIQARELAKRVYQDLKSAFPDVVPLNVKADDLCLAVAIGDMALNIFTSIRLHFGRLPELLEKKLLKISPGQDTATDTDDEVDDDDEAEETEDDQYKFDQGHVLMCWNKYMNLPKSVRPVFVPTAGFKDSFQQLSERALVPLLWGDKLGKVNPPTKTIMVSRVCSREEAERAEQSQYGELIRRLFVGDKEAIRKDPMKRQTSYGKKTTTMELLSRSCPAFSKPSLQEYVDDHFTFINAKKDSAHGSPGTSLSPPPLPTNADPKGPRYALSNQLFTNGLQVHVTAFDTRNSRKGPNQRASIPKLEERFPDRQAIVKDLGNSFREAVVVGVDPGERISAAFCRIDPQHPNQVSNLAIRRSALYSPTLSYRIRQEEAKRRDIIVDGSSESGTIELPSVHEFEQALPATTFNSIQEYEEGLRYYAQVFEILNGYYSTKKLKKQDWEKDKAMRAEKDLAVEGALQMVRGLRGRPALFVYGNGQFNTGIKLASMHETFKHYFMVKATGLKHIVVITDEYNTSAMCPTCVAKGKASRLCRPSTRSTVCLEEGCRRWVDRDYSGAQNMANIGSQWINTLTRPNPLCRPSPPNL